MKRAALLLIIITSLWTNGCARHPAPPPPVVVPLAPCPAPAAPPLPRINEEQMLDTPATVNALWQRETLLRHYLKALRAALACYEEQTEKAHGME